MMVKIPIRNESLFMNLIYFNKVAITESGGTQLSKILCKDPMNELNVA